MRTKGANILVSISIALLAAFLLVILANLDLPPLMTLNESPRIGSSTTSGLMMVSIMLLVAWGGRIFYLCSDYLIRRFLLASVGLLIFWQFACLIKYSCESYLCTTILWYCYYLPMICCPALFTLCSLCAGSVNHESFTTPIRRSIYGVSTLLILIVLTNNLHQWVFVFDKSTFMETGAYLYNWGYYLIVGWIALNFVAAFCLLMLRSRRSIKTRLALLDGTLIALGIYCALYVTRSALFSTNLTFSVTLFAVIFTELCLHLKVFPTHNAFGQIFQSLPLDIRIVDNNNRVVRKTNSRPILSTEQYDYALAQAARFRTCAEIGSFTLENAPGTRFVTIPINGGYALFAEDMRAVFEKQQELMVLQDSLTRQNKLIERDTVARRQLYRQEKRNELYAQVHSSLSSTVSVIRSMVDELPKADTPEHAEERRLRLMIIKMLVAYCKRKGSLVLSSTQPNADFDRERVALFTNETASDLRTAGIELASLIELNEPLPAETMSIIYDCFYSFCLTSFYFENPVIMFFLHTKAGSPDIVEMRIVLEGDSENAPESQQALAKLNETLSNNNVAFRLNHDGASLALTVLAQKKDRL